MKPVITQNSGGVTGTTDFEDRLLTLKEVAQLTGLKVSSLYHFTAQNRIPTIRLSRRCLRVRLSALHAWWDELAELGQDKQIRSQFTSNGRR